MYIYNLLCNIYTMSYLMVTYDIAHLNGQWGYVHNKHTQAHLNKWTVGICT